VFEETPKGKVLVEKAYEGVTKALDSYEQTRVKVALLREPGRQLASRIREGDPRGETFRKMLQSDAVLALLDVNVGGEEADPAKVIAAQIRKALSKVSRGDRTSGTTRRASRASTRVTAGAESPRPTTRSGRTGVANRSPT